MPSTLQSRPCTLEEYRATPEGNGYQLIGGELFMAPAPSRFHQDIVWNLSQILGRHLASHPQGRVYVAPFDVFLSERDVVQPDVLFVANANRHRLAEDGLHGPPDLVIEILSPSSGSLALEHSKRMLYARSGVPELWLVDPSTRRIHLYHLAVNSEHPQRIVTERETLETAWLPGLVVAASEVFRR